MLHKFMVGNLTLYLFVGSSYIVVVIKNIWEARTLVHSLHSNSTFCWKVDDIVWFPWLISLFQGCLWVFFMTNLVIFWVAYNGQKVAPWYPCDFCYWGSFPLLIFSPKVFVIYFMENNGFKVPLPQHPCGST
jgi:hypothetical protein